MHGRMIHSRTRTGDVTEQSQAYDARGRFIRAADRAELNKALINQLATFNNVKLFFEHKLTGADFDNGKGWIENRSVMRPAEGGKERPEEIEISFDLMIGADGAHSAVRFHMMKFARVSYQQEYIDTLWCEFHILPKQTREGSAFAISPNHLHIWPSPQGSKDPMMFIAIPSADKSFTCTLFAPPTAFDELEQDPDQNLLDFFDSNFPGVSPNLIPKQDLIEQFKVNSHLPLVSIKCEPYHYTSKHRDCGAVIIGDAAHAMVPFYGQGMNAGLEDVRVLFEHLDIDAAQPSDDVTHASGKCDPEVPGASSEGKSQGAKLASYTCTRKPAAHAIVDLSMRNFVEMRESVTSPIYLLRKKVEELLSVWLPKTGFATQYSRVSFSDENYDNVINNVKRQETLLERGSWACAALIGIVAPVLAVRAWRR